MKEEGVLVTERTLYETVLKHAREHLGKRPGTITVPRKRHLGIFKQLAWECNNVYVFCSSRLFDTYYKPLGTHVFHNETCDIHKGSLVLVETCGTFSNQIEETFIHANCLVLKVVTF
jgi:hypothetical protein